MTMSAATKSSSSSYQPLSAISQSTTPTRRTSVPTNNLSCIQRHEILVLAKLSRFDRDKATLQPEESVQDLLDRYKCMGEHGSRIMTSHWSQQEALRIVQETLLLCNNKGDDHHETGSSTDLETTNCKSMSSTPRPVPQSPQIVHSLDSLNDDHLSEKYKLIVSLGGDDFFKMVASRLNHNSSIHSKITDTKGAAMEVPSSASSCLLLLGVNSDPATSRGALLPITVQEFPQVISQLEQGQYRIEHWTRIQVKVSNNNHYCHCHSSSDTTLGVSSSSSSSSSWCSPPSTTTRTTRVEGHDDTILGPALNDVFLGQCDSRQMSKHQIVWKGEKELHQGSGLLVSTGTGSTGWFASASGMYLKNQKTPRKRTNKTNEESFTSSSSSSSIVVSTGGEGNNMQEEEEEEFDALNASCPFFSKSAPLLKFILREPVPKQPLLPPPPPQERNSSNNQEQVELPKFISGSIHVGETLRIVSLNDQDGIVSRDSMDRIPFPRGSIADISIHPSPLSVVLPVLVE